MNKKAIEALRNGLEDSHWYSDDDESIFNELVRKAKAYDEVSKAYEYYMPNGETQFSVALASELNRILISNFRPPADFSEFKDYSYENFNDHKEKSKAFDEVLKSYDTAPSYDEIGEEVIEIVNKFRGSEW